VPFVRIGRVGREHFGCEVYMDEECWVKLIPDDVRSIVLTPEEFWQLRRLVEKSLVKCLQRL